MVHSGGAMGGHYYSYIKSFENDLWYCFNDTTVDRISFSQVTKMFGDKVPKCKDSIIACLVNSGVSAYFLMYRRVDVEQKGVPSLSPAL